MLIYVILGAITRYKASEHNNFDQFYTHFGKCPDPTITFTFYFTFHICISFNFSNPLGLAYNHMKATQSPLCPEGAVAEGQSDHKTSPSRRSLRPGHLF